MSKFLVLVWFDFCFTALHHILGHFGCSQLPSPHCSWASLQYLVHILSPVTDNCSSWISGRGRTAAEIFFMTKSPWKDVPDVGIELGAACMPSGHASDRATIPDIHFYGRLDSTYRIRGHLVINFLRFDYSDSFNINISICNLGLVCKSQGCNFYQLVIKFTTQYSCKILPCFSFTYKITCWSYFFMFPFSVHNF